MQADERLFCSLERCTDDKGSEPVKETYQDLSHLELIRQRLRDLWNDHRQRCDIGMAVKLRNRWDDEMEVIITDEGWILTLKMKEQAGRLISGDLIREGTIAFISPDGHWSVLDKSYLIAPELAERMIVLWLCMREIPRRWSGA